MVIGYSEASSQKSRPSFDQTKLEMIKRIQKKKKTDPKLSQMQVRYMKSG